MNEMEWSRNEINEDEVRKGRKNEKKARIQSEYVWLNTTFDRLVHMMHTNDSMKKKREYILIYYKNTRERMEKVLLNLAKIEWNNAIKQNLHCRLCSNYYCICTQA